jgi:hypothetical protein
MAPAHRVAAVAFVCAVVSHAAPSRALSADRLNAARGKALAYFAERVESADPSWLGLFGYMHRRFGIRVTLKSGEELHTLREGVARPETYAIYRRIDDPEARIEKAQIAALPTPIDRITASALHCDRIALPAEWIEILRKASRAGAYALTHAVLATEWTIENGCLDRRDIEPLHAEQVELLEKLIGGRAGLAATQPAATDLWIEAMVMLDYSGESARLRPEWVEEMLDLQRADGGWPRHPRASRSDAHATALALWIILEHLDPRAPHIRWIAAPRRDAPK